MTTAMHPRTIETLATLIRWENLGGDFYASVEGVQFRLRRVCADLDVGSRWTFDAFEGWERLLDPVEIGSERTTRAYALRRATRLAVEALPRLFA